MFLDGERASYLSSEAQNELLLGAAERITGRYYELASDLVSVVSVEAIPHSAHTQFVITWESHPFFFPPKRIPPCLYNCSTDKYSNNLTRLGKLSLHC